VLLGLTIGRQAGRAGRQAGRQGRAGRQVKYTPENFKIVKYIAH